MRIFFILFWTAAIFILTCTVSFNDFIEYGVIQFQWNGYPRLTELLSPLPVELSRNFLLQKCGHLFAFFILTLLIQTKFRSKLLILSMAVSYSALTEVLQLFFTRDGRMFDIGFDTVGILLALAVGSLFIKQQSRPINL